MMKTKMTWTLAESVNEWLTNQFHLIRTVRTSDLIGGTGFANISCQDWLQLSKFRAFVTSVKALNTLGFDLTVDVADCGDTAARASIIVHEFAYGEDCEISYYGLADEADVMKRWFNYYKTKKGL